MFYVIAYFLILSLAFSGKYWELAFWFSLAMSINFVVLYLLSRCELKDAKEKIKRIESFIKGLSEDDVSKTKQTHEVKFAIPDRVIPGTYGMVRDYGHKDDDRSIDFSKIDSLDFGRLSAALSHIDRMMSQGRSCYVVSVDGFSTHLITRSGSSNRSLTYIKNGEAVTKSASDLKMVVISPRRFE